MLVVVLICKNPSGDSILQMDQQQWFIKRLPFERCSECHLRPMIFHQIYHVSPSAFCLRISMGNLKVYLNWIILVILILVQTVLALKYGQSNWLISMAVATVTLRKFSQMQYRLRAIFCFHMYQLKKKKSYYLGSIKKLSLDFYCMCPKCQIASSPVLGLSSWLRCSLAIMPDALVLTSASWLGSQSMWEKLMLFTEQVTCTHLCAKFSTDRQSCICEGHLAGKGSDVSHVLGEDNCSWHKWALQSLHKGNDPYKNKLMCYIFSCLSDKLMHVMLHCYLLLSPKQFIPGFHHHLV